MSYVTHNLLQGEKVKYFSRPHSVVFAMPVTLLVVAFLLLLFGAKLPVVNIHLMAKPLYRWVSLLVMTLGLFSAGSSYLRYVSSEFAVTDKRILMKIGLLRRKTMELFLAKVEAIDVDQSIPGRLLNYGSLQIVGTGGTRAIFHHVKAPLKFRKAAQQQIDRTT